MLDRNKAGSFEIYPSLRLYMFVLFAVTTNQHSSEQSFLPKVQSSLLTC